jgi:hypothetical protein
MIIFSIFFVFAGNLPNPTVENSDIDYEEEYEIYSGIKVINENDGKVYLIFPERVYVNKTDNLTLIVENVGLSNITEVFYDIILAEYDLDNEEEKITNFASGEIDKIEKDKYSLNNHSFELNRTTIYLFFANISDDDNLYDNFYGTYLYPLESGANVLPVVTTNKFEFSLGESVIVDFELKNYGNEDTINGRYDVYLQEGSCGSAIDFLFPDYRCNNYTLIDSVSLDIDSGESVNKSITLSPDKIGKYTVFVNYTSDNNKPYLSINYEDLYYDIFEGKNYGYFNVKKSGSDLYGELSIPDYGFGIGLNTEVNLKITNEGNELPLSPVVRVYEKEGYCNPKYEACENLTLIEERSFDMVKGEEIDMLFNISPRFDSFTLIFNISAQNEIKGSYVLSYFGYSRNTPKLVASFKDEVTFFKIGHDTNITFDIKNIGISKSNDFVVSTSILKTDLLNINENFTALDSYNFVGLESRESKEIVQPLDIRESGIYTMKININDSNVSSNKHQYILSMINGLDIGIYGIEDNSYYYNDYNEFIVGEKSMIRVYFMNFGDAGANNSLLTLYANNIEAGKKEIDFSGGPKIGFANFDFIPVFPGETEIKAVISHPSDVNTENNVMSVNYTVYKRKYSNVTFEFNMPGVRKYYEDESSYYMEITGNNITLSLFDGNEKFRLIFRDDLYRYHQYTFFNTNLSNSEKIKASFINDLSFYSKNIENIIAINTSFKNHSYLIEDEYYYDYNQEDYADYVFNKCSDFNFASNSCKNNWSEDSDTDNYRFYNGFIDYDNVFTDNEFDAGGFSETNEFRNLDVSSLADIQSGLKLERGYGYIKFSSSVNVTRFRRDPNLLKNNVLITLNKVKIDNTLSELINKPAHVYMRGIDFKNPIILKNGATCNSCTNINYDKSSDILRFDVSGFSEYTIVEGEYCGNNVCSASYGEACDKCVADCGLCSEPPGDDVDDINTNQTCSPRWTCEWGPCLNGAQSLVCNDANRCNTISGKPTDTRSCSGQSNCIDSDGDGYGTGTQCLGFDINDNDPAVHEIPEKEENAEKSKREVLLYTIIIISIVSVIAILLILAYKLLSGEKITA